MDLHREGLVDTQTVVARLNGYDLDTLERTRFDVPAGTAPLTRAVPASIGVAVGVIAFSTERALALANHGNPVVLIRTETATEDIAGIAVARGLLTASGFRTSHAAVVARQLGRVCLVGCRELSIDPGRGSCIIAGQPFAEGDLLSLDGNSGAVYAGVLPVVHEKPLAEIEQVRRWQGN
jgi:pyruvate,orthophosphate dikinase